MKTGIFRALRSLLIAMMGTTTVFTFLSGAGTSCVALAAERFGERMVALAPYRWLYVGFVVTALAVGVAQAMSTRLLIKGRSDGYRQSVIALATGALIGIVHMLASRSLRGSSMPVDIIVLATVLTLLAFLLVRIPPVWQRMGFARQGREKETARIAAAMTLISGGLLTLTVQSWAGPAHMLAGVNYADSWHPQLAAIGIVLLMAAFGLVARMAKRPLLPGDSDAKRAVLGDGLIGGEQ